MRLEVVIVRSRLGEMERFGERLSRRRPSALFVDALQGLMRRGDVVVKASGLVCRCVLSLACGAVISLDEMAQWEYADRHDGGPESARHCILQAMIEARAALAALGYVSASEKGRGFSARALQVQEPALAENSVI